MSDLTVRRLLVDMKEPFARHWCRGEAFSTAMFNALSMSFRVGEQFFIDSVRHGFEALPPDQQDRFRAEVQGFVGQEASHRRLHCLYNEHLEAAGLMNAWEPRARKRLEKLHGKDPRYGLAMTAAHEHFTAMMADWMLRYPEVLGHQEPRLATLWLWHSAEETEHRATAFDLFHALGGKDEWRLTWFRRITWVFVTDTLRQTVTNLRHDGTLWKLKTWVEAWRYLFGRKTGLVRHAYPSWRRYFAKGFHPGQQDGVLSREWLRRNEELYIPVGR